MQPSPLRDWDAVDAGFESLPTLRRGESKDIRIVDDDHVIVRLIPSLYSFTHNRSETIAGTDALRLRSFRALHDVLVAAGIATTCVHIGARYYVTRRMIRDGIDVCPPIEVVVKARHVGTPKHGLYRIADHPTRDGSTIRPDMPHAPYVRFDYTNPLVDADGKRLRDECIPTGLARRFIDADAAEATALRAFAALHAHLGARGVRLDDICFKIAEDGLRVFGEISPDCMRAVEVGEAEDFYGIRGTDASKDTFRAGSALELVHARYARFCELVEGAPIRDPVPLPTS